MEVRGEWGFRVGWFGYYVLIMCISGNNFFKIICNP